MCSVGTRAVDEGLLAADLLRQYEPTPAMADHPVVVAT